VLLSLLLRLFLRRLSFFSLSSLFLLPERLFSLLLLGLSFLLSLLLETGLLGLLSFLGFQLSGLFGFRLLLLPERLFSLLLLGLSFLLSLLLETGLLGLLSFLGFQLSSLLSFRLLL